MYRFNLGDRVVVASTTRDPGGVGTITGRESKEDNRGVTILYRVLIEGHSGQEEVAKAKERSNNGFWYRDDLVTRGG